VHPVATSEFLRTRSSQSSLVLKQEDLFLEEKLEINFHTHGPEETCHFHQ
jgi:hypothetical protein